MGNATPDQAFINRVLAYLRRASLAQVPFSAVAMCELAPGIVGVHDTTGAFDAYFDRERWIVVEEFREHFEPLVCPPALEGTGIGILEKTTICSSIASLAELSRHARLYLKPLREDHWHNTPIGIPVQPS